MLDYQCVTSLPVAPSRHHGQSWHGPASRTDASRRPVCHPAIPVLAVTRCAEYEKKVSLWVKKKMDNDLHDNTE